MAEATFARVEVIVTLLLLVQVITIAISTRPLFSLFTLLAGPPGAT